MKFLVILGVVCMVLISSGCDRQDSGNQGGTVSLTGAGATFPQPLYDKWASQYSSMHSSVRINYQGIGSGGGIIVRRILRLDT